MNRTWRWLAVGALAVLVFGGLTLLVALGPPPLSVRFVGYGTQLANYYYVFEVSNRLDVALNFQTTGEIRVNNQWPSSFAPTEQFPVGARTTCLVISSFSPDDKAFRLAIAQAKPKTVWDNRRKALSN